MAPAFQDLQLLDGFDEALALHQFSVCYQAQYNHATGLLVGAEALVRWQHPQLGLLMPGDFIPALERAGLVPELDLFVFEEVCALQNQCIAEGLRPASVSVNASRLDLFMPDFVERLEAIRQRLGTPVNLLRIEITESAWGKGSSRVAQVVRELHAAGYKVEMDDFGSGYSSLNSLKDIEFDGIKLDMRFLSGEIGGRGGIILSSIVNMASWLSLPVIAEGVETLEQADYMRSIGCPVIQGFFYASPVPAAEYRELLGRLGAQRVEPALRVVDRLDPSRFWSPESLETLIFNNYVGSAAIFQHDGRSIVPVRVNPKYLAEIGMNQTEQDIIGRDYSAVFDPGEFDVFLAAVRRAEESGLETECETWRTFRTPCCGENRMCIRTQMRVIGTAGSQRLLYAMVRNVTAEKQCAQSEERLRRASDQANVYCWEYIIPTREMHTCFRCMRDLGLPAVVHNYPEPVIESGLFPPECADRYRDWMRQLAEGVPSLEGIFLLTDKRIPFCVRYTTEFDEAGRPVRAFGSATPAGDGAAAQPARQKLS